MFDEHYHIDILRIVWDRCRVPSDKGTAYKYRWLVAKVFGYQPSGPAGMSIIDRIRFWDDVIEKQNRHLDAAYDGLE